MKVETIRVDEIPVERTMNDAARQKLALLRSLKPGTAAKVEIGQKEMRGFKTSITRIGNKHGISVVCTADQSHVYIRLSQQSDAGASKAD